MFAIDVARFVMALMLSRSVRVMIKSITFPLMAVLSPPVRAYSAEAITICEFLSTKPVKLKELNWIDSENVSRMIPSSRSNIYSSRVGEAMSSVNIEAWRALVSGIATIGLPLESWKAAEGITMYVSLTSVPRLSSDLMRLRSSTDGKNWYTWRSDVLTSLPSMMLY